MNRLTVTAIAAMLALAGCSKASSSADPKAMTGPQLTDETHRCRDLGLKVYDDQQCQAAQREQQRRFLGEGGGPPK